MPTVKDYEAVARASSSHDLLSALLSVAHKLDFPFFGCFLALDRQREPMAFVGLNNAPPAYLPEAESPAARRRDPVMRHLKKCSLPLAWDQSTYVASEAADLWEVQAPYGYKTGICVGLRIPGSRHFCLGVDRPDRLPADDRRRSILLAHVQSLAIHAHEAAVRVLEPLVRPSRLQLTAREVEVLHWTMLGKDALAIAEILGLSRRTVKFHAENAIEKLDCENKHAAVLKALDLGLIRWDSG